MNTADAVTEFMEEMEAMVSVKGNDDAFVVFDNFGAGVFHMKFGDANCTVHEVRLDLFTDGNLEVVESFGDMMERKPGDILSVDEFKREVREFIQGRMA